jgi:hypothetical protein
MSEKLTLGVENMARYPKNNSERLNAANRSILVTNIRTPVGRQTELNGPVMRLLSNAWQGRFFYHATITGGVLDE